MTTITAKRRRREQLEPPSELKAMESAATESTALKTVLFEIRRMREEITAKQDKKLQLLRRSRSQRSLSRCNI
ncbi:hypothetical protein EAG_15424 [Camponotus floridanus]|uniref:Uncharacterized protein n=1 Tax=Camponotus floridanus TaxID=104421 RepID=E2APA9_CAMFO|nr:hypothetical protein EAG_15424 [Camponotus floridanus]